MNQEPSNEDLAVAIAVLLIAFGAIVAALAIDAIRALF